VAQEQAQDYLSCKDRGLSADFCAYQVTGNKYCVDENRIELVLETQSLPEELEATFTEDLLEVTIPESKVSERVLTDFDIDRQSRSTYKIRAQRLAEAAEVRFLGLNLTSRKAQNKIDYLNYFADAVEFYEMEKIQNITDYRNRVQDQVELNTNTYHIELEDTEQRGAIVRDLEAQGFEVARVPHYLPMVVPNDQRWNQMYHLQ
jgi:hypothetical protein